MLYQASSLQVYEERRKWQFEADESSTLWRLLPVHPNRQIESEMSRRILTAVVALPLLLFHRVAGWIVVLCAHCNNCRTLRVGTKPARTALGTRACYADRCASRCCPRSVLQFHSGPKCPENMELTALFPALLAVLAAVTLPLTHRLIGVTAALLRLSALRW